MVGDAIKGRFDNRLGITLLQSLRLQPWRIGDDRISDNCVRNRVYYCFWKQLRRDKCDGDFFTRHRIRHLAYRVSNQVGVSSVDMGEQHNSYTDIRTSIGDLENTVYGRYCRNSGARDAIPITVSEAAAIIFERGPRYIYLPLDKVIIVNPVAVS